MCLYNHQLDTFVEVADAGSFLKAAEKLYMSNTAVYKQMNLLERDLGMQLFERNHKGVTLTPSGKVIYEGAKQLRQQAQHILDLAEKEQQEKKMVIRVGSSLMNPVDNLIRCIGLTEMPDLYSLKVVPYEDTNQEFRKLLEKMGQEIDIIAGNYDCSVCSDRCRTLHLLDVPWGVLVPKSNYFLIRKEKLEITDLHYQRLIMPEKGLGTGTDQIFENLQSFHPQIHLLQIPYYQYETFNQAVCTNALLLSTSCWKTVHPMLQWIPVDWPYTTAFGILYGKDPSEQVKSFVEYLQNMKLEKVFCPV